MPNISQKLEELIKKREQLLQEHCKDSSWAELCNYPQERYWYSNNIWPIDNQIIIKANALIAKFSIPCKPAKSIHDVYSNKWLDPYTKQDKKSTQPVQEK